jgi:hypothetical protein
MTKLRLAVLLAAAFTVSAPVLASQNSADATVASSVANTATQGWCSGPRQHTDFRCFKN